MTTPPPIEVNPPGEIRHTIVWLHGLGADGRDFLPLVPELRLPDEAGVRFVFPNAPRRPVTVNGGMVMPAWYDIYGLEIDARIDVAGIQASAAALRALMEAEVARGVAPEDLFVAGFSQGGLVALVAALEWPGPLGGVLALSTYLPQEVMPPAARQRSIFQAHGRQDQVVPLAVAEAAHQRLLAQGHQVDWHEYDMGHSVCPAEIEAIRRWLSARL